MSADVLRRAASLMRERAEAASRGDWAAQGSLVVAEVITPWSVKYVADCYDEPVASVADAAHIAAADPPFMLAVAVWLDSHADIHVLRTCDERLVTPCPALAVARAYVGADA